MLDYSWSIIPDFIFWKMLERVHPNIAGRAHSCENQDQRVCYHRSLQRDITREHGDTDKEELNSLKECFDKLVQHVLHNLIENQQFSTVSKLSAFYAIFKLRETFMSKESCIKRSKEGWSKNSATVLCFIIKKDGRMSLYTAKAFQLKRMKKLFFSQKNQKRNKNGERKGA